MRFRKSNEFEAGKNLDFPVQSIPGASLVAQTVKNLPTMWKTWVQSLGGEDPLEEGMATHSNILLGKSHGQRSQADYSPCGSPSLT